MTSARLLFVHAHPDDETIATGATIAHYARRGAAVTVVTCTLGEQGEILVPELAALEADQADQLGGYRIGELADALVALGVTDHRFLGGAGAYRDSGMRGAPSATHPRAFARAAVDPAVFDEAVGALARLVRALRPDVVVTYDENGDYGHPDHVMAHRVTMAAVDAAAVPDAAGEGEGEAWTVPKLYWTATPRSAQQRDHDATVAADTPFAPIAPDELDYGVPDELVTAVIDASDALDAKVAALAAHRTQVLLGGELFALSNGFGRALTGVECYRLVRGEPGGDLDALGRETDLLGGLA